MNVKEVVDVMLCEYNIDFFCTKTQPKLGILRISQFMASHSITDNAVKLTVFVENINHFTLQRPLCYKPEMSDVQFLCRGALAKP